MSSDFLTLYHATKGESVYEVRPQDDFASVSQLSALFDGWIAKFSLQEQENNIKKNNNIFTCDLSREKIARKKDLIRNDDALRLICNEISLDDMNFADMVADLVFESPDMQNYTYDDVIDGLPLKLPANLPVDKDKLSALKLRFAQYEIMRLLGQVARIQGYDAISIFREQSRDVLIVNPDIVWCKYEVKNAA